MTDWKKYLLPTAHFDSDNQLIEKFVKPCSDDGLTQRAMAVCLYYKIRDDIFYNPFDIRFDFKSVTSSSVVEKEHGHCVDKAGLMVSCCRLLGIPARIGLAKVRNHMGTARLEQVLKTDVLVPLGYTEVYLNEKWLKCTPAFNKSLCEKLGVKPLEWDGKSDSIFQQYDREGGGFMEYIEDYGTFEDIPQNLIFWLMKKEYPQLIDDEGNLSAAALKID